MRTVDMYEAKTHLSSLVDAAVEGNPFIITRAGKPVVKVIAVEAQVSGETRRLGFLAGRISLPRRLRPHGVRRDRSSVRGWQVKLLD